MPRKPKTTLKDRRVIVAAVQAYLKMLYTCKPIMSDEIAEQLKTVSESLTKILD